MRSALRYLLVLLSGALPLLGQSEPGTEKPRKPGRAAWFACIADLPEGVGNPVKVVSGEDLTDLELPRFMTSEPVKIAADGIVRIVRMVPDPENPAKPKILVLAEAKIAEGVREALIILAPLPEPKGELIFLTKVQDLASFKGGDRLYLNMSTSQIRVRLGDESVTVAPGQASIYESPVLAKPENTPIMYEFYAPEQKKWRMITASTVVLRPTRREICVFNTGSRPGNIRNHKILFPVQGEDQ